MLRLIVLGDPERENKERTTITYLDFFIFSGKGSKRKVSQARKSYKVKGSLMDRKANRLRKKKP